MPNLNESLLKTPDLNAERLQKLKELFPDLFTVEGRINTDELTKLVDPEHTGEPERYEFKWFGKANAKRNAFTPTNTTLVFDEQRSVNPDKSENIIIEGENLEVLKLLLCGYREKIKCIYIDPPYNTGKDFVYSDNYTEEKRPYWEKTGAIQDGVKTDTNPDTSGRYHSDWLDMMYSRLLVARALLKPDGVIFISNDNEAHNLRKLCDEVFGEENFVECVTWNKRVPKNDKGIGNIHEFILIYVKDSSSGHEFVMKKDGLSDIDELIRKLKRNKIPVLDAEGEIKKLYRKNDYDRGITLYNSLTSEYRLWGKINMSWPNADTFGPRYEVLHPVTERPVKIPDRGWRWKESTFDDAAGRENGKYKTVTELEDGSFVCNRIWFSSDEKTQPSSITYFDEVETFLLRSILSTKSDGGIELEQLFDGKSYFSYPKPTSLIQQLIDSPPESSEGIFLDFFAGSGTTGHAITELNKQDGGNRKYILVQIPELTDEKSEAFKSGYTKISDITIERNKRVVERLLKEKADEHPELFVEGNDDPSQGLGFKVFKLVESNFPRTEFKPDEGHTDEEKYAALQEYIREKESQQAFAFDLHDLITEILIKQGFNLNFIYEQRNEFDKNEVFHATDGEKQTLICLDADIKDETIGQLKANKDKDATEKFICLERALDTTKKWNLNKLLGERFKAI